MPSKINVIKKSQQPIIVVCGAPGVGKSAFVHYLSRALNIHNRTARSRIFLTAYQVLMPNHPALQEKRAYAISPLLQVHAFLEKQARLLSKAINAELERCYMRGNPFILTGDNIFPRFLNRRFVTLCVTLSAPNPKTYSQWLHHPSWRRRYVHHPLPLAQKINQIHLAEAKKAGTPVIRESNLKKRVMYTLRLLNKKGIPIPPKTRLNNLFTKNNNAQRLYDQSRITNNHCHLRSAGRRSFYRCSTFISDS